MKREIRVTKMFVYTKDPLGTNYILKGFMSLNVMNPFLLSILHFSVLIIFIFKLTHEIYEINGNNRFN